MSALPWFAFDLEAYTANTMHLTTEEHGAYLLMMLAYYRTEKPLLASDRALSSLTKLPMDRWLECKPTLAAYFIDEGSHWRHERIEKELLEASSKHAARVAHAKLANDARHSKSSSEHAPSRPQASSPKPSSKKSSPIQPTVSSEDTPSKPQAGSSPTHLQLQEHLTLSSESVNARTQGDEIGLKVKEDFNPLGTVLPPDWVPDDEDVSIALGYGMDNPIIHEQLLIFHALNTSHGTFSKNWKGTWRIFCSRWKDLRKTAPAPRVEVNASPLTANYERAAELWARGGTSKWSHQLGPEPGQIGCRCPAEILTKHKIDPKTGLMVAPSKEPVS